MKRFLVLMAMALLMYVPNSLRAQEKDQFGSIIGYVHETSKIGSVEINLPIWSADVSLYVGKDTLKTQTKDGEFFFKDIPVGAVNLEIKKEGFARFYESIAIEPGEKMVVVELMREGDVIEGAVVSATMPLARMRGDTLVYNAQAVKQLPGDFTIDIIRQLPGAEVDGATIKIGGKTISRAYVNGTLIFGRNPMDAVSNLSADEVTSIDVYDEEAVTDIPEDNLPKERVMDIHTKHKLVDVKDVQLFLSGGSDPRTDGDGSVQPRYAAAYSGRYFSESLQIKSLVMADNVGMSQHSLSLPGKALSQYSEQIHAGVSVEKYWGRSLSTRDAFKLTYDYDRAYNRSSDRRLTDYFASQSYPARNQNDSTYSSALSSSHALNLSGNVRILRKYYLRATGKYMANENASRNIHNATSIFDNGLRLMEASSARSELGKWQVSNAVRAYADGLPDVNASFSIGRSDVNSWTVDTMRSSASRRILEISGGTTDRDFTASLQQRMRIAGKVNFTAGLHFTDTYRKRLQTGINTITGTAETDFANTQDYTYSYASTALSLSGNYKFTRISIQPSMYRMVDRERFPDSSTPIDNRYLVLAASGEQTIPIGGSLDRQLIINYRLQPQLPSMEQVQPLINNDRALYVTGGNPALKPSAVHSMRLSFTPLGNLFDLVHPDGFDLSVDYTSRPMVSRMLYFEDATSLSGYEGVVMPAGSTLNTTDNADWAVRGTAKAGWSWTLSMFGGNVRPLIKLSTILDGSITPQYFGTQLTRTRDLAPSLYSAVSFTLPGSLRTSLWSNLTYLWTDNAVNAYKAESLSADIAADLSAVIAQRLTFDCSYRWTPSKNITTGQYYDYHFIKASVGTKLLNGDMTIRLEGVDMLNNPSRYSLSMLPYGREQRWTPTFGKYIMLSLTYRFNSSREKYFNSSAVGVQDAPFTF